ncbi:acid protease [Acephala macrosclerotiorum]|nr:acid protease [Acephala macrosclerotiorum]
MLLRHLSLYLFIFGSSAAAELPPIHYAISRRGGSFPAPDTANLTYLLEQIKIVEQRFSATTRTFSGNKVVRKPKYLHGTQAEATLLELFLSRASTSKTKGSILTPILWDLGNWFASLHIGDPTQEVDMDLDMVTADFWILSTSSDKGSFFLDFNSKSYVDSEKSLTFPTCRMPKDLIHLPTIHRSVAISFAHCRPSKQWIRSLLPSGAYLGLAPSTTLSQTKTISLMPQLIDKQIIDTSVWSIMLVNGKEGIFSMGGTSVASVREVERETEDSLARLEYQNSEGGFTINDPPSQEDGDKSSEWKWMKVQGAEGWWQILMRGLWVDGVKVLDSQPVVLDVNTPFIIAPPLAARTFYASISGSKRLSPPYDQFHSYPCFNPPRINFEFDEWKVQVLNGRRDKGTFSPGGRFSLGRQTTGSGYCIGIIVESRMGLSTSDAKESNSGVHIDGGNGLSDLFILGEPFYRDVQVAFHWRDRLVGMQKA